MATLKIYGVYDLMEWRAVIPCANGSKLHVMFEGGSASVNGTVPATYRTSSPVIQAMIESCEYFKKHKIRLLKTFVNAGDTTTYKMAPLKKKDDEVKAEPVEAEPKKADPILVEDELPAVEEAEVADGLKVVKVSDLEGAGRNYLIENFGLKHNQLKTMTAIKSQAKAHGIEFVVE